MDPFGQQRTVGQCRDGPFAVRPRDLQRGVAPLRMPERGAQCLHVLQTELDPEILEGEKTV